MTRVQEYEMPFLARFAEPVDGEVRGRTVFTKAAPETYDDEPGQGVGLRSSGRTLITAIVDETTDDN